MQPHCGIINTARGGLIDDKALATALHENRVGFAALDAFQQEPLPQDSVLRSAPRTILTPHSAAFTDSANRQMGCQVVRDVVAVLRGNQPEHEITAP